MDGFCTCRCASRLLNQFDMSELTVHTQAADRNGTTRSRAKDCGKLTDSIADDSMRYKLHAGRPSQRQQQPRLLYAKLACNQLCQQAHHTAQTRQHRLARHCLATQYRVRHAIEQHNCSYAVSEAQRRKSTLLSSGEGIPSGLHANSAAPRCSLPRSRLPLLRAAPQCAPGAGMPARAP